MPLNTRSRHSCFLVLVASFVLAILASAPECTAQEESEKTLVAILVDGSSNKPDQAMACKKLAVVGSADCVDALAGLLDDSELTSWARIALEAIESKEAEAALVAAADSVDGLPLVGVVNSLGAKRSRSAVGRLASLLENDDVEVAKAAALSLGKIAGNQATDSLKNAITDPREDVRSVVAEGLIYCAQDFAKQGDLASARSLYDLILGTDLPKQRIVEATRGAILSRGVDGIERLVTSLGSEDFRIRGIALKAARQLESDGAIEALIAARDSVPASQRALYLHALGDRGESELVPTLQQIIETQTTGEAEKEVTLVAIEILSELGDVSCLESLAKAAKSDDATLSNAAINTLANIDDDRLDDAIVKLVNTSEGEDKQIMIRLIGARRIQAIEPLLAAVEDSDSQTRRAALESLGNVASLKEIPVLVERATGGNANAESKIALQSLKTACIRIPDQAACAKQLSDALAKSAPATQLVILETLAGMGGPDALKVIGDVAANGSKELQNAATRLLGSWMTVDAGPVLMNVAKQPKHAYRIRALRAYLRLVRQFVMNQSQRNEMAQTALKAATRDAEKTLLLDAAQRYPSVEMLQIAVELSKQPTLKEAAQKAALKIAGKLKRNAQLEGLIEELNLPKMDVKITKAVYGAKGQSKIVTDVLQEKASNSPLILLDSSNYNAAFGGDVAPGLPKTLTVNYSINGKVGEIEFKENDAIVLPTPES